MTLDYYYGDQAELFSFYRIEMSEMIATANAKSIGIHHLLHSLFS